MQADAIAVLTSPAVLVFVALMLMTNSVQNYFSSRGHSKTIDQITAANRTLHETNQQALVDGRDERKKLMETLTQVVDKLVPSMSAVNEQVTAHSQEADERHKTELEIQQQVADTVTKQTEIMEAQLQFMDELEKSDKRVSHAIESEIAPGINAIRLLVEAMKEEFDTIRSDLHTLADNKIPENIESALNRMTESVNHLAELIGATEGDTAVSKAQPVDTDEPPSEITGDEA